MVTDISTVLNRKRVIDFAAKRLLPAIYEYAFLAHDGGLMAYGPNMVAIFDRAAGLVDQILKGASPADLPLELPTRFDLAINLETAKTTTTAAVAAGPSWKSVTCIARKQ